MTEHDDGFAIASEPRARIEVRAEGDGSFAWRYYDAEGTETESQGGFAGHKEAIQDAAERHTEGVAIDVELPTERQSQEQPADGEETIEIVDENVEPELNPQADA